LAEGNIECCDPLMLSLQDVLSIFHNPVFLAVAVSQCLQFQLGLREYTLNLLLGTKTHFRRRKASRHFSRPPLAFREIACLIDVRGQLLGLFDFDFKVAQLSKSRPGLLEWPVCEYGF